jgi:starch-binding outer membrane protein, SusD/RagB family
MKKYLYLFLLAAIIVFTGCEKFLDRSSLTTMQDDSYWSNENNVRMFANGFYANYFVGYNSAWGVDYAPLRGYYFADDFASSGKQSGFEVQAPSSRISTSETPTMMITYAGPSWNFVWVRKSNLFLERIEGMKDKSLNADAYKHWSAVARFFRGYEYSRLVSVFGDVPYFDKEIKPTEFDQMYKDRDNRTFVMDKVYDDFVYVMENMKLADINAQYLNRYMAASFISRFMLFEGTWQKYHLNNQEKAKKYLALAESAAAFVMNSGRYNFTSSDFRSLFGSADLSSNKEVIMWRKYDAALGITHHIASYSNITESQSPAPNLKLAKAFLCNDGRPYKLTTVVDGDKLDLTNMVATRDSRFEATFWDKPRSQSTTLLYAAKFIDRVGPTFAGGSYPAQYGSNTNTNAAPVIRLAEVVLNWIEAKAELATMGTGSVTQADLDASINAIRNRPLASAAVAKGVKKTAPLTLANLFDDPDRDADVPALIWEIRRERRMEFVFEHSRLLDIKRWKKISYMRNTDPDNLLGLWINFPVEFPAFLVTSKRNILKVRKLDGTVVTYNSTGTNGADMVGFYVPENVSNRDAFTDRVYLAPIGTNQIAEYADKGYVLTQTPGW